MPPGTRGAVAIRSERWFVPATGRCDEGPLGEEEALRRLDAWWAATQQS